MNTIINLKENVYLNAGHSFLLEVMVCLINKSNQTNQKNVYTFLTIIQ